MIEHFDNGNLITEHIRVGYTSDSFKIIRNENNLSDKEIAKILNDEWYGEKNPLDFYVLQRKEFKIIQIFEDMF